MKYKIGDSVASLIEKGTVKEGDVGCIDAIHEEDRSYTVGFYATEDALLYSGRFFEEELSPHVKKNETSLLQEGDVVELLSPLPGLEIGNVGEVVALVLDGVYAVSFGVNGMTIPLLVPVKVADLHKIGHHEPEHHH